jgi:hypothetical protein
MPPGRGVPCHRRLRPVQPGARSWPTVHSGQSRPASYHNAHDTRVRVVVRPANHQVRSEPRHRPLSGTAVTRRSSTSSARTTTSCLIAIYNTTYGARASRRAHRARPSRFTGGYRSATATRSACSASAAARPIRPRFQDRPGGLNRRARTPACGWTCGRTVDDSPSVGDNSGHAVDIMLVFEIPST